MDKDALVKSGQALVSHLENNGVAVKAAVWMYYIETDNWHLWMCPKSEVGREHFYLACSKVISASRETYNNFDIAMIEFKKPDDSILSMLGIMVRVEGLSDVDMEHNTINGLWVERCIVLRLAM